MASFGEISQWYLAIVGSDIALSDISESTARTLYTCISNLIKSAAEEVVTLNVIFITSVRGARAGRQYQELKALDPAAFNDPAIISRLPLEGADHAGEHVDVGSKRQRSPQGPKGSTPTDAVPTRTVVAEEEEVHRKGRQGRRYGGRRGN